jgi:hypothetical protein
MEQDLYETNELENAVDYLEMLSHFLAEPMTGSRWKWVIIAAHQALYSFSICALRGTAPSLTVTDVKDESGKAIRLFTEGVAVETIAHSFGVKEEKAKSWLANPKLIGIHEALKRMKNSKYLPWAHSQSLVLTKAEETALDRLISEYRNEFEHFVPKTWLIYTTRFPAMLTHVMRVVRFIALESNAPFFHPDDGYKQRIEQALLSIEQKLSRLQATQNKGDREGKASEA